MEVGVLWLVVLVLIRIVVMLVDAGLPEIFLAAVPILFMYAPVWLCNYREVDSYDRYPLALPALSDRATWWRAIRLNVVVIGVISIPFLALYHYWQTLVFGFEPVGLLPSEPLKLIGYHLFFVAIPEEFFYRGYIQSRLDEAWSPRWKILGATLGPGWLVTCVVFAFGHSLVQFQWWHFAIIIPSLAFGWMRARTGNIVAGAFFHAWCNITVSTLDTWYGILPP
jgi:uncharacterized protein